jgi:hypothetical protein
VSRIPLISALLIAGCGGSRAATTAPVPAGANLPPELDRIREADVKADLYALAGDHFRGRESGTLDELKASAWIAERAREAGLEPGGDDGTYFQFWPLKRVRLSTASMIEVGGAKLALTTDAVVFSLATALVDAPIVMAGDGRAAALEGLDLAGKVAVVQMTKPDQALAPDISLRQMRYAIANLGERVPAVAAKRPAAIVLVADAVADSGWNFLSTWYRNGSYGLEYRESLLGAIPSVPVIWVHQSALPKLRAPNQRLTAHLFFEQFVFPSVNVIAKVPGTDPALAGEYVLFSAHQDHDGVKEPVAGDSIWNGADDNGSTSVGILAIGRAWAKHPAKRSALFVWHGARRRG